MSCLGLRTWDPMWSGKSQIPCSQQLRLHILTSSDVGLRLGTRCEMTSSNFQCSQWRRLPGLISSNLRLRTWDPMWTRPLGLVHMGSQVPNPTHVSKSQHGGNIPTIEPQETIKIRLTIIEVESSLFHAKTFMGLVLRVGSNFLLDPTRHHKSLTSPPNSVAM
jgi:hypothetical protein